MYDPQFIDHLEKTLPPFFRRADIEELTLRVFKKSYMAYLECKGTGPKKFRVGNKVMYRREDFIEWMRSREDNNEQQLGTYAYGVCAQRPEDADFGFERTAEGSQE